MEIGILTAFLAGIVSFLSPCVLPLAPPYLAYLGGTSLDQISGEKDQIDRAAARRVFISAVFFVLGLATVFVALGMGASVVGQSLNYYKAELALASGCIIYVLGQHFIGLRNALTVAGIAIATLLALRLLVWGEPVDWFTTGTIAVLGVATFASAMIWGINRVPVLDREARFEGPQRAGTFGTSYVIGIAFAFGWTPCIGPILGAILALALQEETLMAGTALLAVYALGLGVPFLVAAAFVGPFLNWARNFRKHMGMVEKIMGVLLIVVGSMMITGDFERLAYFLLETFPSLATFG